MLTNPITESALESWSEAYRNDPQRLLATVALSKANLADAIYSVGDAFAMQHKFSIDVPTLPVTDQQQSGRCWLFAATNVLRERIAKKLNLEQFQLSQSYLAFWDKFERINYFLDCILDTADLPTSDRTVSFILQYGVHDGGQWEMFVNIVRKYGVVPRDVYGETYQSCHTNSMNHYINRSLKACAVKLRGMVAAGASEKEIQAEKNAMLQKFYGFLCSCYTEPPKAFDFEYVDKDKVFHAERGMTPQSFCEAYVGDLLDHTVSIINAPTEDKPWHKTYTVRYLGNVTGGNGVKHLNLPMDEFKAAILRQLQDGKIVWFGSDVAKFGEREIGIWDDNCFKASLMTGLDLEIGKADSLDYNFAAMNHAMCITGVNLVDGKPNRWKIENSWGDKNGAKGYYICSDSWFDAYVFQATVEKEYLGDLAALAEAEPIVLDPWDPIGTLAD